VTVTPLWDTGGVSETAAGSGPSLPEEVLLRLAILPVDDACALLEEMGEPCSEDELDFLIEAYEHELGFRDASIAETYGVDVWAAVTMMLHTGNDSAAYHEIYDAARDLPDVDADQLVRYLRVVTEAFIRTVEKRAEDAGLNPGHFGFGFGAGAKDRFHDDIDLANRIAESVHEPIRAAMKEGLAAVSDEVDGDELDLVAPVVVWRARVINRFLQSRFDGVTGPDELRDLAEGAFLLAAVAAGASGGFAPAQDKAGHFATPLGVPRSVDAAGMLTAASYGYLNRLRLPEGHLAYAKACVADIAAEHGVIGHDRDIEGESEAACFAMTIDSPSSDQAFDRHLSLAAARSGPSRGRLAPGAIHSIINAARFHTDFARLDEVRVPQYLLAGGITDPAFGMNSYAQRLAGDAIGFHALTAVPFYVPAALMSAIADAEPLDPGDLADLRLPYRANLCYFEQPIDVTAVSRTPAAQPILSNDSNGVSLILPPDRINGMILFSEEDGTIAPLFMWIGSFDSDPVIDLSPHSLDLLLDLASGEWLDKGNGPDPYHAFVSELIQESAMSNLVLNARAATDAGFVFQPAWLPDCDYPDIVHAAAALISWGDWRQPDPYTLPPEGTREHRKTIRSSAARKAITRGQTAAVNIAYLRPRNQPAPTPREPADGDTGKKASPKAHLRRTHWRRSRVATRDTAGDIVGDVHGTQGADWHYVRHLIPAGVVNPTGAPADPDRVYKLVPRR